MTGHVRTDETGVEILRRLVSQIGSPRAPSGVGCYRTDRKDALLLCRAVLWQAELMGLADHRCMRDLVQAHLIC